jgi:hypothetical protein
MMRMQVVLRPMALTHLVALQQLTLDGVDVDDQVCEALAEHLGALQQLRVHTPLYGVNQEAFLPLLGRKLTVYTTAALAQGAANQLVQLTRLVLSSDPVPRGTAEALAALTRLQELSLQNVRSGGGTGDVLEQVAAMSQLRSLQLRGIMTDPVDVRASLAQCTQLTALELAVSSRVVAGGNQAGLAFLPVTQQLVTFLPVPQQLVGLRHLTVPVQLLEQEAGAWLAPLTALTHLCVSSREGMLSHMEQLHALSDPQVLQQVGCTYQAKAQALLQQVAEWPASLQQVVFWVVKCLPIIGAGPSYWQHTPAQPGGKPFAVWLEEGDRSGGASVAQGWVRPFRPCPHLPGVWELQGECKSMD